MITKRQKRNKGAALIEYGLLVGLVSVLAIGSVVSTGDEVAGIFTTTKNALGSSLNEATSSRDNGSSWGSGENGEEGTGESGGGSLPTDPEEAAPPGNGAQMEVDDDSPLAWTFTAVVAGNDASYTDISGFANMDGYPADLIVHTGNANRLISLKTQTNFLPSHPQDGMKMLMLELRYFEADELVGDTFECSNGFSMTLGHANGSRADSSIKNWQAAESYGYNIIPFENGQTYTCQIIPAV